MLTIKEIQQLNHGDRVVNAELEVKTICNSKEHKRHQTPEGEIIQPVILTDNTGDILAYVWCPNNETIQRMWKMTICGYVNKESGLRIDVISWSVPTQSEPDPVHYSPAEVAEYSDKPDWNKIKRENAKRDIICAAIAANQLNICDGFLSQTTKEGIEFLMNYIFE